MSMYTYIYCYLVFCKQMIQKGFNNEKKVKQLFSYQNVLRTFTPL